MLTAIPVIAAAALSMAAPQRAAQVAATLGVNVHVEYTDGEYRDVGHVLACLDYIGVHQVRDDAPNPANQGQGGYLALAKAGVSFDLFVNGSGIKPNLQRIARLDHEVPGSVISIEGINEVNNHAGYTYAGERDLHKAGALFQAELYQEAKAFKGLSGLPVLAFTDYPYTSGPSDEGNLHVYPAGGSEVGAAIEAAVSDMRKHVPGQPIVITELGYSTAKGRSGVSDLAQARLLLTSLLTSAAVGVRQTYIYELLDAYADPAGADQQKHYGLFGLQYAAKPAARMLHLFTEIYADPAPNASSFPLRPVKLSWSGEGRDVRKLIVQKASGEIVAAVWRDVKVYDAVRGQDIDVPPENVDLRLASEHGDVIVTDAVATNRGRIRASAPVVRLPLGANPLIVQIKPSLHPDIL